MTLYSVDLRNDTTETTVQLLVLAEDFTTAIDQVRDLIKKADAKAKQGTVQKEIDLFIEGKRIVGYAEISNTDKFNNQRILVI